LLLDVNFVFDNLISPCRATIPSTGVLVQFGGGNLLIFSSNFEQLLSEQTHSLFQEYWTLQTAHIYHCITEHYMENLAFW
jgi:hypothetical protein